MGIAPALRSMDETPIKVEVNAVRLQQAVLCADCDVITDSPHDTCLACGSRSLLPLARVLGGIRPTSLPATREGVHQDSGAGGVFVLTTPMPLKARHRRISCGSRPRTDTELPGAGTGYD